jgi:hypothetical protein
MSSSDGSFYAVFAGSSIQTARITGGAVDVVGEVGELILISGMSNMSLSSACSPCTPVWPCTSPLTASPTVSSASHSSFPAAPHAASNSAPAYSSLPPSDAKDASGPPDANDESFTLDANLASLEVILAEFSNQIVLDEGDGSRYAQLRVPKAAKATSAEATGGGKGGKDARGKGGKGGEEETAAAKLRKRKRGQAGGSGDDEQPGGAAGAADDGRCAGQRVQRIALVRPRRKVRVRKKPPVRRCRLTEAARAAMSVEAKADEGQAGGMYRAAMSVEAKADEGQAGGMHTPARAEKKKRPPCPHGKRKERCFECGGNQVCIHRKIKDKRYPCAQCEVGAPGSPVRTTSNTATNTGVWNPNERRLYQEAVALFGAKEWRAIARHVGTRDASQARTHGVRTRRGEGSGGGADHGRPRWVWGADGVSTCTTLRTPAL